MGELVRETPYSEITATLEVLDRLGIGRADLARLRSDSALARSVVQQIVGEWFTFQTSELTLNELRQRNPDLFYQRDNPWWENEDFANKEGEPRTLSLRTSAAPKSYSKTWVEQQKTLGKGEFVPIVRDVVDGMIAYYKATGKSLFSDCYVRTQDVSSSNDRVLVGFDSGGLYVGGGWDDLRFDDLGLSAARSS